MKRVLFVFAAAFTIVLQTGCKKEISADPQSSSVKNNGNANDAASLSSQDGTTFTTVPFVALANVRACLGYNIRFAGNVEMKTHQVVKDGVIQTYTRQWSIKGLTATSWSTANPLSGTSTVEGKAVNYVIQAGSEMFAVQDPVIFSPIGTPGQPLLTSIFIHQGTIVLQNTADPKDKLVIRHQIVKTPNSTSIADMPRMGWYINGQHCGM